MPTLGEISQFLTACAALGTLGYAIWNRRLLKKVEKHTDGMVTRLEAAARAKGVIQGKAVEKAHARNN